MHIVLAIDDDKNILKLLAKQVESMGHKLIGAASGSEGIEFAQSGNPDLILLDILMPNMDGFEVIRKLKKNDITKKTPIIMLTSRSQKKDVAEAMRFGVTDYIIKPHNFFILSKKIDASLRYGMKLRAKDIIERTNTIDISRARGRTVISFKANLCEKAVFIEARKVFNSTFINLISNDDVVIDLRAIQECSDRDMVVLEKIIELLNISNLHVVAGKNYGFIVEKGDLEEKINLFITLGDFEIFINKD